MQQRVNLLLAVEMDCGEAFAELQAIETMPGPFGKYWKIAAAFLCAAGFALLFGGAWMDLLIAGAAAFIKPVDESAGKEEEA